MSEQLNIYQKLARIRKQVEVVQKDKKSFTGNYVSDVTLLAKITGLMHKLHLSLIPGVVPGSTKVEPHTYQKTKSLKDGKIITENVNEVLVSSDTTWTWVNDDNPEERIVIPWTMVGQQSDASQAFGSGLTYSFRYFLLKYFNCATPDDDPDNWRGMQKKAEEDAVKQEKEALALEIINEVHGEVLAFLETHKDERENITKIIQKHAKQGTKPNNNYYTIKDPAVARRLKEEIEGLIKSSLNNKN